MYENLEYYESPLGLIVITAADSQITQVKFADEPVLQTENPDQTTGLCKKELQDYFSGKLKKFSVALRPEGTEFQKSVWNSLLETEYGTTLSYTDIAEKINRPKAVRAVGNANGKNPIHIIVPCHRIIARDGKYAGYAAGTERKIRLLEHERRLKDVLG